MLGCEKQEWIIKVISKHIHLFICLILTEQILTHNIHTKTNSLSIFKAIIKQFTIDVWQFIIGSTGR